MYGKVFKVTERAFEDDATSVWLVVGTAVEDVACRFVAYRRRTDEGFKLFDEDEYEITGDERPLFRALAVRWVIDTQGIMDRAKAKSMKDVSDIEDAMDYGFGGFMYEIAELVGVTLDVEGREGLDKIVEVYRC